MAASEDPCSKERPTLFASLSLRREKRVGTVSPLCEAARGTRFYLSYLRARTSPEYSRCKEEPEEGKELDSVLLSKKCHSRADRGQCSPVDSLRGKSEVLGELPGGQLAVKPPQGVDETQGVPDLSEPLTG